jgi:hypothetical protein
MAIKIVYAGILLGLAKAINLRPDMDIDHSIFLNETGMLTSYNEASVKHQVIYFPLLDTLAHSSTKLLIQTIFGL